MAEREAEGCEQADPAPPAVEHPSSSAPAAVEHPVSSPPGDRAALLDAAPEAVRGRIAELVAQAVGHLPAAELPAIVRPVARFAPTKRAKVGAGPMLAALRSAEGFADEVVAWWSEHRPAQWSPPVAEPVHAAAVAVLRGDAQAARELLRETGERADLARVRAERDAAVARSDRLAADLERVVGERDAALARARDAPADPSEEVAKLRARLREQGVRLRRAQDAAGEAASRVEERHAAEHRELEELRRERGRDQEAAAAAEVRARRASSELESLRRSALEARQVDDARLALLVDTVAGAAAGLRRELGLRGDDQHSGSRPADLVESGPRTVGSPVTDAATLDRLLALPEVHLIVDGYNVTKTGWPSLPLATQRERLVGSAAPLAARTHAETTLVFDGAGVVGVPTGSVRGVRVLFSDPGVTADDLIRLLVDAEPQGRPLVVVSSDRAVADSVRRRGAHPVPSSVLLERLSRI